MMLGLLAVFLVSCDKDDDVDYDTYSVVYDVRENLVNSTGSNIDFVYGVYKKFETPLNNSDVVLIYRQDTSSGTAVWKLLPKTYYFEDGELDYHFDFTANDIQIFADANFNLTTQSNAFKNQYLNNQIFRIVLVPASFGNKNNKVDYNDYESVIKYYNINETNVSVIK